MSADVNEAQQTTGYQHGVIPLALGGLVLVLMMPFIRPPTGNEVLIGHDLLNQQYPLYSFIFDSVRRGDGLPMWNPYLFAGQSIVSNPQSTIYYPPAWIMAVIGVPRGVGWLVVLHLWLGGWGMAMFAHQLGARRAGALVGGIIFSLSGVMSAHLYAGHVNYLMCAAWLPWMAAAYVWAVGQRYWTLAILPGAAAFGMCILTGYPPLLYFGALWLAVMAVYVVWTRRAVPLVALRSLAAMVLTGGLLGAAMLLPVADFTLNSTRTAGSLGFSNSFAMPPAQLITLLIPNLFGEPTQGYWGLPFYEELTGYIGILPLAALVIVRRRAETLLLAGFMLVGVWVSLGIDGGLFSLLYSVLPGYSLFRVPPRALYFFMVGGAGLAALLVTDLQLSRGVALPRLRPMSWLLLLMAALIILIGVFASTIQITLSSDSDIIERQIAQTANMTLLAGLAVGGTWLALRAWTVIPVRWALAVTVLVVLLDLGRVARPLVQVGAVDVPEMWKTMSRVAPASPDYRVMTVPNHVIWQAGATYTRHLNASGYDPLVSAGYQRLLDASDYNPTSPIARLLGVRYLISDRAYEFSGLSGLEMLISKTEENGWTIYEIHDPMPRAFIAPDVEVVADDEAARLLLAVGEINPLTRAIASEPVDCSVGDSGEVGTAVITDYTPNQVVVKTNSETAGLLVLTDSYDPNWTVNIDGHSAEVLRVFTALRGVCVGAGAHEVVFRYEPRAFYAGVVISAVGWGVIIGIGVMLMVRRLRRNRERD